jgi:hypothetical protein
MKWAETTALPFSSLLLHSSIHFPITPLYTELYLIAHSFFTINHFFPSRSYFVAQGILVCGTERFCKSKRHQYEHLFVPSLCAYCCSDYKDVISIIIIYYVYQKPA